MPFGIFNALITFIRLMNDVLNDVLRPFIGKFIVV